LKDKYLRTLAGALCGMGAAGAALFAACLLVRALGAVAGRFVPGDIAAILSQLSSAHVLPPVLPALVAGAVIGALWLRGKCIVLKALAVCAALLPVCLWFSDVNAIRFGTAVGIVLDMVRAGVF